MMYDPILWEMCPGSGPFSYLSKLKILYSGLPFDMDEKIVLAMTCILLDLLWPKRHSEGRDFEGMFWILQTKEISKIDDSHHYRSKPLGFS